MKKASEKSKLESYIGASPYPLLTEWFKAAREAEPSYFDAAQLATVDDRGMPNIRTVLIRSRGQDGFVFYTNLDSKKGRELAAAKKAALLFYWKSLSRQIRIRGTVTAVSDAQADTYFAGRPLESRIAAHVSLQSSPLSSRAALMKSVELYARSFTDKPVPRPSRWSGYCITPIQIEFWEEGLHRLHDRLLFERKGTSWKRSLLYP